ncbi:fluoride efflux transporter CrcB [Acetobacterium fimetarium]|uniref:Fluoride-specific ion channel FluC n=1 Tax=Acetobacterium fimetarium TaxID=52691 RepID=A0ABR6WWF2_9FIRM|nr:CrcB family protein [Acetobacterium fimetarium]MBC3804948.1 fluoride efflux transporter CrcB [Acetobacterium fimetarium]
MMKKYCFIAAGGAIGALLRYGFKTTANLLPATAVLPNSAFNILLINLLGCLLLGMFNAVFSRTERISTDLKLGVTAGFVGAFTTFSTFCKESLDLLDVGLTGTFFYFIAASLILGITAVYIGNIVGHRVVHPVGKAIVSQFGFDYN